jgi:hypothetical protein
MKRRKYTLRQDEEWFRMPLQLASSICCCDCGLVHRIRTRVTKSGRVYMAAQRDDIESTRLRKKHKKRFVAKVRNA